VLIGTYTHLDISLVVPATYSTTRHTKRQGDALRGSLLTFGQIAPYVVREIGGTQMFECIDGSARLELQRAAGAVGVDVFNLGPRDDDIALAVHLALNLDRGKPHPDAMAAALETVIALQPDDRAKAKVEVELIDTLTIPRKGVDQTVAKLRSRGRPAPTKHNPASTPSWVEFKMKVDHAAAKVCDRALSHVEQSTGCQRHVAFERICADYLAGAPQGGTP
jgi:ParB-like chromosome segregation protein Spo0J